MVAVVDETTNLVYLFGDPDAEQKVDEWAQTGAETFDHVEGSNDDDYIVDFSFLDVDSLIAA